MVRDSEHDSTVSAITVKYSGGLRSRTGVAQESVRLGESCATLSEVLAAVERAHPDLGGIPSEAELAGRFNFRTFLNGRGVQDGENHLVHDGDELLLMLPLGGG